ncbi:MAG TPA: multiheme c-type cytochrome [Gemmatimonadota bacterium]|nr:multiheme c-type cytochrome [Gemmatimonadota bacterium]
MEAARKRNRGISRIGFSIVSLTLFAASGALAQDRRDDEDSGERLYISRGCLGCHGASGRGGVGPALAGTLLPIDAFLGQIRRPRDIMPAFPEEVVSEDDAEEIHEYLQDLPRDLPRLRAKLPRGIQDPATCAECHRALHATVVRQFESSAMGLPGTQNPRVEQPRTLTCADCHGTDHDQIMASLGRVPETTCAGCHAGIYQEHVLDAGHSYGPGPGDLGINWERNIGVPNYAQMPRKVMEMGCDPCHAQAGATDAKYWSEEQNRYVDTSSLQYRNGCIACHTRHSFSLVEARKPEACYTCHMGPDHPNYEAYMSSKHGSIYVARGDSWDWTTPMTQVDWDAPTCAYCHMVYVGEDGVRTSSHNMSRKIVWGMGTQAAGGELADVLDRPENRAKRLEMVRVCMTCHSEDKARGYLRSADAHKLSGDALVIEARELLAGLYEDGLIEPSHGWRAAGLLPGPEFSAVELPNGLAAHWPAGLYYDVTAVEREYFDMFFFSNLKSYKGAFHMSPDYAWWYGYADVLGHLARLRDEEQQLREARATGRRTMFMLLTGPLMVAAILLAAWLAWRAWQGREAR